MWISYAYQTNSYWSLVPIDMKNTRVFTDIQPFIWDDNVANSVVKQMNSVVNNRYEVIHPELTQIQKVVESYQHDL